MNEAKQTGSGWPARRAWWVTAAGVLAVLWFPPAAPAAPLKNLNRELRERAPAMLAFLRTQGYRNVGVLKFHVKKNGQFTDRAGTLNLTLARRLETALLMAKDADDPLGIIQDASAVAATLRGANHMTPEGRQVLFAHDGYPLLWGRNQVRPDAFLTGLASVGGDLRAVTVSVAVLDHKGQRLNLDTFSADLDTNLLIETGHSFRLRGLLDDKGRLVPAANGQPPTPQQRQEAARQDAAAPKPAAPAAANANPPAAAPPAARNDRPPVVLEIYYDNRLVVPETDPATGQLRIPGPQAGQKVKFVLRKNDNLPVRYAAVLKVNGENTLFRQRLPADRCRKWILSNDPADRSVEIQGFQVDGNTFEEFVVLTREESREREIDYGKDVGQITLVVYRERAEGEAPPSDLPPGEPLKDAITQAKKDLEVLLGPQTPNDPKVPGEPPPPEKKPETAQDAKQQIQERASLFKLGNTRKAEDGGLIVPGAPNQPFKVRTVPFNLDPNPLMAVTVVYYQPAARP